MAPRRVARAEIQRLVGAGARPVEVLPRDEYDEEDLPGARRLPLKTLSGGTADSTLERGRPVIVYCWDALRDVSPWVA